MTITNSSLRLVALVTGVAVALVLMGAVAVAPAQAAGLTQTQIQSIVSLLASFGADAATIANVTAALNGQATPGTGTNPNAGACPALSRSLQQGSSGADVKALQVFLNGNAQTQVSVSGAGSPGSETTFFGPATAAAVKKFQTLNNVSSIGIVGPQTRAAIAAVCGTGTPPVTPGTPTTGGSLTVSAAAQPVNSLAPQGASRVPFTTFTLTNNSSAAVTVNSVTIQRVGLGVDANFSGIVLLDSNGLQIGTSKTLNSNHQANIGDAFTIGAGQSVTLTVAGNIATGQTTGGQVVALQVVAINTGATVSGSLPINGASQTINTTLTLGSVSTTTSSFDPGAAQTKSIGDSGVRVSGLRFTAGSAEDLKLYSVRWRQVGTASASDIANVVTVVGDTSYPTVLSADGKYYTTIFPGGLLIAKGNSVDMYNKVDLVGSNSASRTVKFDIDKVTDVYFVGQTYGYGVAPSGTWTPWFTAFTTTINAGSATTIGKATEVPAQNIAANVPNQVLGGFVTDFKGEAVSVTSLPITIATSSTWIGATGGVITSISIVDQNGVVVAGPVDEASTCTTGCTVTFTDTITFPVGRKVWTIKGKIPAAAPNNGTVIVTTVPSSWSGVTGQTSGNSITISQGSFDMNTMTVKAATLTIALSSTPSSQNIVSGGQNVLFANVQLDASQSGENVRISALPLRLAVTTVAVTDLTSCQLFNSSGVALNTGGNVPTTAATNTFTFDNTLEIPKGTVVNLALKCNVASGLSSGNFTWSVNSGDTFNATGVVSGNSISETVTTQNSGVMTVASGSLTVSIDSSSPSYALAAGGQTGVTMGVVKLRAANEALNLNKLGLTFTLGSPTSTNAVYLYAGNNGKDVNGNAIAAGTLVGTVSFSGSATTSTSTLSTVIQLPKDVDATLTIKADLSDIGSSVPGPEGAIVKLDPLNAEGSGANSGTTIQSGATAGVAGVRVYNTYPTVALDSLTTGGIADGILMRFKVTANAADPVGIGQLKFTVSTTTASVTNVQLFAYTQSNYTSPVSGQGTSGQIGAATSTAGNSVVFSMSPDLAAVSVPAGGTLYFELKGSVAGDAAGASVLTTLKGDASASPSSGTDTFANLAAASNFVWSPNATGTAATSSGNDWTNGYGVSGLPSGGLFQTRSH